MSAQRITKALTTLLLMAASGALGFFAVRTGMEMFRNSPVAGITLLVLLVPTFFLVVAFHEAGHAEAGVLVDFDFRMYVVGPFLWMKEQGRWKFRWNRNVNLSGGMVVCLPASTENLARRFAVYAMGGPAASALLTALAYLAMKLVIAFASETPFGVTMAAWLGMVSFFSLLIFIITIIPLHTGGFYTDGARTLRFLRGGDVARFELLLLTFISSSAAGVRPRDLNESELREALALADRLEAPMKVYVLYYLYQSTFDQGRLEEAEDFLVQYTEARHHIPAGMQGSVFVDGAFFYAVARKDLEKARAMWSQYVPSALIPKASVSAVEAALHHLAGDASARDAALILSDREMPNMLDQGVATLWREKLRALV